jgi:hypothetical protein
MLQITNIAEQEIKRYKDPWLWAKHVCNIDLSPIQEILVDDLLKNPLTVNVQPPRLGKTFSAALACNYEMARHPWEDARFFAPARYQAYLSLREIRQAILQSPILTAYLAVENGKRQFRDHYLKYRNGSNAEIFGQYSNLDGVNASLIMVDETDDIDQDRLMNSILTRGARANRNGQPTRIRLTGVIQGRGNLLHFEQQPNFVTTTKWTMYHALEFGIIDETIFEFLRTSMSPDQWLRLALVMYAEGRTFFPPKLTRSAQLKAASQEYKIKKPRLGHTPARSYPARGSLHFGLDCGAAGTTNTASFYSLTIVERIDDNVYFVWGKEWKPTENPKRVREDIVELWAYYQPNGGYGDAYGLTLIQDINADLYDEGLTHVDVNDQDATEANWKEWSLTPLRNNGPTKHRFYQSTKRIHAEHRAVIPDVKDHRWEPTRMKTGPRDPTQGEDFIPILFSQLNNLRADRRPGYDVLTMEIDTVGDDNADSYSMAVYHADVHGQTGPMEFTAGPDIHTASHKW